MDQPERDVTALLLGFVRTLRHAGVGADPQRAHAMLAAVDALGVTDPAGVYWGARLTLCSEPDDFPTFDATFRAYFRAYFGAFDGDDPTTDSPPPVRRRASPQQMTALFAGAADADRPADRTVRHVAASDTELLRQRDIATLSPAERQEIRRLLALLAPSPAPRFSRRQRPARRGALVDPARTVARMLHNAGEPARLAWRAREPKPRRLVLLVDVSGSMAAYADALLRFAHAAVQRHLGTTEVFTIGTRMTRITRALRLREPDAALAAGSREIPDWSGGTRLGQAMKAFLDRWGQRGVARGAIVVVFSDGWERGDPGLLAEQVRRLARLSYRIVWVNPHKGKAGYAPLAGGMAAALPHVHHFVAGHTFDALEELVEVIAHA